MKNARRYLTALMALALSISLVSNVAISAFALETTGNESASPREMLQEKFERKNFDQSLIEKVETDISNFKKLHLTGDISISAVDQENVILYQIEYAPSDFRSNSVVNYVKISEESDGTIHLSASEGDKHDAIMFKPDGSIFLDGREVSLAIEGFSQAKQESAIMPRGARFFYDEVSSVPGGYVYGDPKSSEKISLGKYLSAITRTGLIAILSSATRSFGAQIVLGGWTFAIAQLYDTYYSYISDKMIWIAQSSADKDTEYVSLRITKCEHKDNNPFYARNIYKAEFYTKTAQTGVLVETKYTLETKETN